MKNDKRNKINRHHGSYNKATEHALRAIYEEVSIKIEGQVYSYDKQRNELSVQDFYGVSVYKPLFNAGLCDPFNELIRKEYASEE